MISDQPQLVVKVVFEDLGGRAAYGFTDNECSTVYADELVLENDPVARATAFEVLVKQAALQKKRFQKS